MQMVNKISIVVRFDASFPVVKVINNEQHNNNSSLKNDMDNEIIAFSPVWIAEIFRTVITLACVGARRGDCIRRLISLAPSIVYSSLRSRGTKLFLSVALILTKENLFASSNLYNIHILLRLGKHEK